jgi:hypothetical protein
MDTTQTETAPDAKLHYVSDMLLQLKVVAGEAGGPFLTYLLEMARAEAIGRLQRFEPYPGSETRPSE